MNDHHNLRRWRRLKQFAGDCALFVAFVAFWTLTIGCLIGFAIAVMVLLDKITL